MKAKVRVKELILVIYNRLFQGHCSQEIRAQLRRQSSFESNQNLCVISV